MKVYEYANCSTCRAALKYLDAKRVSYERIPIREHPPTQNELKRMLVHVGGNIRRLFNTSGEEYRSLGLKEKLDGMSEAEAIELLNGNGKLVKRPFLLEQDFGLVGFKPEAWDRHF